MAELHRPTESLKSQVEAAAGLGLPQDQIGALIGVDAKTLRRYYRHELDLGKAKASAQVAKSLFNKATSGNDTTAMIWWTKAQMGWGETNHLKVTTTDDIRYISSDELRKRIADAERLIAGEVSPPGGYRELTELHGVHDT